jgi:spore maturation protein CgeB
MDISTPLDDVKKLQKMAGEMAQRLSRVSDVLFGATNNQLGGSGNDNTSRLTVGTILDEFSHECFAPQINAVPISTGGWQDELRNAAPVDALFVESAWVGNGGDWKYFITKPDRSPSPIKRVLEHCKSVNIPSVFWNKEDPVHFERFSSAAKLFEHIFTTDAGVISEYQKLTGRDNAHVLMFAAEPSLHNPVRQGPAIERVAFTGSWRGVKYPHRAESLHKLLTPAAERGILDIFDRFAGEESDPDKIFPDKFKPYIRGALAYPELVKSVYKKHMAFINVNSVENSDTMLARRVFEILACGSPVISSYSPAIEKTFGSLVAMPRTAEEAGEAIDKISGDPIYRARLSAQGVRLVHSQHTYRHRVEKIAEIIGKPAVSQKRQKVSIVCNSKRPDLLHQAAKQILDQDYPDKEIIFVAHSEKFRDDDIEAAFQGSRGLRILRNETDKFLAHGLNKALEIAEGDLFAKFDDDDYYAPNYLPDSVRAFGYAPGVGVVGKHAYFVFVESLNQTVIRFPGKHYRMTKHVAGATLLIDRKSIGSTKFELVQRGTDSAFIKECNDRGVGIFATDPFNYLHVRYAQPGRHTWNISDEEFVSKTELVGQGILTDTVFV